MNDVARPDKILDALGKNEWRTRDGRCLQWSEMDTDHLRNTSAMLRRNGLSLVNRAFGFLSLCQGEHAQDAAESEIASSEAHADQMFSVADDMARYAAWREARR